MPAILDFLVIALSATSVAALPTTQPCLSDYSLSEHVVPLYRTSLLANANYEANITIGSQTVLAVMDTGSSDTWFLQEGFQCLDGITQQPISDQDCGFHGPRLTPSSSFQPVPDVHLNITYLDTESVIATEVYSNISLAGLNISKQQIGLVETAAITYSGYASGLVGLAYPANSNVFAGVDPSLDERCGLQINANKTNCTQELYSPLLSTIWADSLSPPVFSFALSRSDSHGGFMSIGGLPDLTDPQVNVTKDAARVTVPNEILDGYQDYIFYSTSIDGFEYTGAPAGAGAGQYIVDTGTVPNLVDKESAQRINALFDPPAYYNDTLGYLVACNATAPDLAVTIAGVTFGYKPSDLIRPTDEPGVCFSGVQPSESHILGSIFLRNVLAVFDVGNALLTFASRVNYQE